MLEQDQPQQEPTVDLEHKVLRRGYKVASSSHSGALAHVRKMQDHVMVLAAQRAELAYALRRAVLQLNLTKELALQLREQGSEVSALVSVLFPQPLLDELDVLLVMLELDLHLLDRIRQRADVDYVQAHQLRLRLLESITKNA